MLMLLSPDRNPKILHLFLMPFPRDCSICRFRKYCKWLSQFGYALSGCEKSYWKINCWWNAHIGLNRLSAEVTANIGSEWIRRKWRGVSRGCLNFSVPYGQSAPAGYSLYQRVYVGGGYRAKVELLWEEQKVSCEWLR